jgi:glycosyltransferase involved in cell wall biosynthesis
VFDGDDWAVNPLPPDIGPDRMGALVAACGVGAVALPFLNGFCYMIRGALLREIGLFDEGAFGAGYGEENDFSIRARQAGWKLAVASDAYVFHAQSRSYAARRQELAGRADALLAAKYDPARDIWPAVALCRDSLPMASVRARLRGALRRDPLIEQGRRRYDGRRVAFILPMGERGGGANVILQEGAALQRMGVEVTVLNEESLHCRLGPDPDLSGIPARVFKSWEALTAHLLSRADDYDAVIATLYRSVYMLPLASDLRLAYYVQDFEPHFFPEDSPEHESALLSYSYSDRVRLLTKTRWNQMELSRHTGRRAALLGPSVDVSAFAPAPEREPGAPLRVAAMLRPSTPRRAPEATLAVMDRIRAALGERVAFSVFGATPAELEAAGLRVPWAESAGKLDRQALATLLGRCDVFLDCSLYQAMGLTALEAMLSGCAVIAPERGGANEFIRTGINGLLLDTQDQVACADAVIALAADPERLTALRLRAVTDANTYLPEAAALRLLEALFDR